MRTCSQCGIEKPDSDFGFYKSGKKIGRIRNPCKECTKLQNLRWRKQNREYASNYWKAYYPENEAVIKQRAVSDKKRRIKTLADSYVREVLKDARGFKTEDITPELIQTERTLIKLKRKIKEIA